MYELYTVFYFYLVFTYVYVCLCMYVCVCEGLKRMLEPLELEL